MENEGDNLVPDQGIDATYYYRMSLVTMIQPDPSSLAVYGYCRWFK